MVSMILSSKPISNGTPKFIIASISGQLHPQSKNLYVSLFFPLGKKEMKEDKIDERPESKSTKFGRGRKKKEGNLKG